jgi:two-component system, LytTR family, sensor kinase
MKKNSLFLLVFIYCMCTRSSAQESGLAYDQGPGLVFGHKVRFNLMVTDSQSAYDRENGFIAPDTSVYAVLDFLKSDTGRYKPKSPIMLGVKLNPALTDYNSLEVLSVSKRYQAYVISDSSDATLIALGITSENVKDYRYHVVENDKKEIVPWSRIPKMAQLYGAKRPLAFLGNYNAPGKKIMIEVINSKDYDIRDGVIFDFAPILKPVPMRLELATGGVLMVINGAGPGSRYATRVEPTTHLPLDLKIPGNSGSQLNMEVQPHETITYGSYLIRNTSDYNDTLMMEAGQAGPNIGLSSQYYNLPGKYVWIIQRSYGYNGYEFNPEKKDPSLRLAFEVLAPPVLEKRVSLAQVLGLSIVTLLSFAILFFLFRRLYRKRLERATQARQITHRQLRAIRAQLNPHFIFNALSSIQNLMNKKDVDGANHYLVKFASLTRKVLDSAEQELISMEEELQALDDYLQMEQLRFRFQYSIEVDAAINQANTEIPVMLLQPFVENAVKHAVSGLQEEGMIAIGVHRDGKDLLLSVKDNGPGFDEHAGKPGKNSLGIRLSRERIALLNQIYKGKAARLTIRAADGAGTEVNIQLNNWL